MSNFRDPNTGEDYPDAAHKHLEDALVLYSQNRYDGAGYLIGYVVECILKSLIQLNRRPRFIHDISSLTSEAQSLAALPGAGAAKYHTKSPLSILNYAKPYRSGSWSEFLRYHPEGEISETLCVSWIEDTEKLFMSTIVEMKKDGII